MLHIIIIFFFLSYLWTDFKYCFQLRDTATQLFYGNYVESALLIMKMTFPDTDIPGSSLSIVYLQYLHCLHCAIVSRHLAVPTAQSICSQCWRQRGFCARSFASSDSEDSVSQRWHTQFHKLFTSVNNSTLHCFLGNISASIGFRRRFGKRKRPHFSREIFCATFPYWMYIFLCPGMSPLISQVLLLIMLTLAHADGYSSLSLASPVLISIPMVFPPVLQACQTKTKTTQCQRQTDDGFTW